MEEGRLEADGPAGADAVQARAVGRGAAPPSANQEDHMAASAQSYSSHTRFVPGYHFVLLPILLFNFVAMVYHAWQDPDMYHVWAAVMAFALIMIALFARVFALKAQDRVIRLEERMRLHTLLPADLRNRVMEFTPEQLIAMRFASDAELPGLAGRVLKDGVAKRDDVKKLIKDWRADDFRV
jgi:hypothetical protein